MKTLFIIFYVTIYSFTFGTSKFFYNYIQADTIYSYDEVDTKPTLEKGLESLYKKWNSLAKYPAEARRNKIEGKVFISFIINENGVMVEPKVLQGLGYGCDEAAIEALNKTKLEWTPGTISGKKVKVRMVLPFAFRLN